MSVWDEFKKKYVQPRVEKIIVGFSGLDPDEYATALTDEQLELLKIFLLEYIQGIKIKIDSGSLDPNEPPPEVQPVTLKPSEIPHEMLDGLLGGDDNGHYHLTDDELTKLGKIIAALIPAGQTEVTLPAAEPAAGTDNHEELTNLLGGDNNEHYHFTEDEWKKLKTLLSVMFRPDSDTPILPTDPTTPSEDEPSEDEDAIPDYTVLFENKEPSWKSISLNAKYKTPKDEGRMYFGTAVKGKNIYQTALVVPTIYNENSNSLIRLVYTTSSALTSFSNLISSNIAKARGIALGDIVYAYMGIAPNLKSQYNWKRHFCVFCTYLNSTNNSIYYYGSSTSIHSPNTNQSGYLAGAYKSDAGNAGDQKIVCATADGGVCIVGYRRNSVSSITSGVLTQGASIGMKVNPGCLRYGAGVFCATGSQGAAHSADGISWKVNKSAPKNMIGLQYRSDFAYKDINGKDCTGAFIACSKDTRMFYFSSDGYNWTQCSSKKVPLEKVIAVAYDPNNKRYCVIGVPGNVACFTQDFVNWTPTYVSKVDLSLLDVIWAFNKFVIMPKNSPNLYTHTYAG